METVELWIPKLEFRDEDVLLSNFHRTLSLSTIVLNAHGHDTWFRSIHIIGEISLNQLRQIFESFDDVTGYYLYTESYIERKVIRLFLEADNVPEYVRLTYYDDAGTYITTYCG
jgi:hypothetical protein